MDRLIQIEEPAPPPRVPPSLRAFLELAFRPLYLAGTAWALVAIAVWIFLPQLIQAPLQGVAWHAHEMMWGFIATIAVGFLLTAGANWTGVNPLQGRWLLAVCVLWCIARASFLLGGTPLFWLGLVAEAGFFLLAAVAMARVVYKTRNQRNYAVPWLVLGLGVTDLLYLLAAYAGDTALLMQRFSAGLLCMGVIALLVARRVIPFFAMRAVTGLQIPMHTRSGQFQLGLGALAIVFLLLRLDAALAVALGLAGALALLQVMAWKPWAVWHKPLLWILYLGYTGLGLGLLVAAAQAGGVSMRLAVPVHVIAMGGFSVLIIGMVTRTALGHLGRALALDRSMHVSYWLLLLAVALRLTALWPSALDGLALQGSALAWVGAFGLYLWRFVPMMIRPRPDAAAATMNVKPPVRPARPL
jgi:uncharacterized protein involved in response to NO